LAGRVKETRAGNCTLLSRKKKKKKHSPFNKGGKGIGFRGLGGSTF